MSEEKKHSKLLKAVYIILICTAFLLSAVVLAVLAIYMLTLQLFTTDIRLILTVAFIGLVVADIYLFILKLSSFSNKPQTKAVAFRQRKKAKNLKTAAQHSPPAEPTLQQKTQPQTTLNEQEEQPPVDQPLKPPVFEKKEEVVSKKVYKPVFGPASESGDEDKD